MTVMLLQQPQELLDIHDGLRIPDTAEGSIPPLRVRLPIDSGLSILFDRGVHFDDEGTCYIWHRNARCYAIPFTIWSHPASPIRDKVFLHWPYGEQLSFWNDVIDA